MKALKCAEELALVTHVESGAVVSHEVDGLPVSIHGAELDPRLRTKSRELPCIAQEVLQSDAKERLIAGPHDVLLNDELHVSVGLGSLQILTNARSDAAQVHGSAPHLAPRHAGQCQHVVDQAGHLLAARPDTLQVVPAFLV